jgi:hypothetical protein
LYFDVYELYVFIIMPHLIVSQFLNAIFKLKNRCNSFRYFLLLLLVLFNNQGIGQSKGTPATKTTVIERTETCLTNPKHTYQIIVPAIEKGIKELALLVVIDPHGDGKLAIAGFKESASKYRVVVAGSKLIKNNDANYIPEIDELIADVKNRFPVGSCVYLGGFSGGARMAIGYAINHAVQGVIACGALAQPEQIRLLNCRIISIIGMDDFNFMEAVPFILDPIKMPSNLEIEITKASHTWPEKELLQQAMGNLLFANSLDNRLQKQNGIEGYLEEQKHRIDSLYKINENIQAVLVARNMANTFCFEKENSFLVLSDQLMKNKNYRFQLDKLSKCIDFETKIREAYYNALFQKDSVWWKKEINVLNSNINLEKDEYTRMTYRRIKGFLGIICFSYCQRFSGEQDAKRLAQILSVYRVVEPQNPEILQFAKVLNRIKRPK